MGMRNSSDSSSPCSQGRDSWERLVFQRLLKMACRSARIFNIIKPVCTDWKNGVSSIFGPITTLFNYFNESKIELTPFFSGDGKYVESDEDLYSNVGLDFNFDLGGKPYWWKAGHDFCLHNCRRDQLHKLLVF